MKRLVVAAAFIILAGIGCAKVQVQAPKDPIKVDISMRLDVYQHIMQDIDSIEDSVAGESDQGTGSSFLRLFIKNAYAQASLSPQAEQAVSRRKDRRPQLVSYEEKGVIGENHLGLVEIRNENVMDSSLASLVKAENDDRMVIYREIAAQNNISVEEVQKLYADRLKEDAPSGTPIEVYNESSESYEWKTK